MHWLGCLHMLGYKPFGDRLGCHSWPVMIINTKQAPTAAKKWFSLTWECWYHWDLQNFAKDGGNCIWFSVEQKIIILGRINWAEMISWTLECLKKPDWKYFINVWSTWHVLVVCQLVFVANLHIMPCVQILTAVNRPRMLDKPYNQSKVKCLVSPPLFQYATSCLSSIVWSLMNGQVSGENRSVVFSNFRLLHKPFNQCGQAFLIMT